METVVVIMQKNKKTGLFEKELTSIKIFDYEDYLLNVYAQKSDESLNLHIKLTIDRDISDWEYNAIFDYYDTDIFKDKYIISEVLDEYNPAWEVIIKYTQEELLEKTINEILALHKAELESVFIAIVDKEGEYKDEI